MSILTKRVVDWASQECDWQNSGELSVSWMIDGWYYAHHKRKRLPNVGDVLVLGAIVEPRKNRNLFRTVDVRVGWDVKMPWEYVNEAIDSLIEGTPALGEIDEAVAKAWFRQYEDIHPFADGNGRSGSILYNWLRGSLPKPIHPPNFWDDVRRSYPGYPEPMAYRPRIVPSEPLV